MKTILQVEPGITKCYYCETEQNLETHHVYFGKNRKISDKNGFVIKLCSEHHRGNNSPHKNIEYDLFLKRLFQLMYEDTNTREEFIKLIGRSYL